MDLIDPAAINVLDALPHQVAAREAFAFLPPRAQEILSLRFFDGYSVAEIASRLGLTQKYAQKLITNSLRRAERIYKSSVTLKGSRRASESQNETAFNDMLADFVEAYRSVG